MSEKELIQNDLDELSKKQENEQIINLERYHFLKENGNILFETITGSQAHGTNNHTSDIDKAFVYILPENDILGTEYKEQLKIHKDFMGYEIRRFLELLKKGNPTVLELLNSPKDCVLLKHPAFDILLNQGENFITKACENAFYGYAKQQRAKAEGLEKMQNWEINRVAKKTPLDFCYVPQGYDAIPVKHWLENRGYDQLFCALTAVNHCRDLFTVFYDYEAHKTFSERISIEEREAYKAKKKDAGQTMGLGYKGIAFEDSNDIRLSNIPLEERGNSICNLSYNKDAYRRSCDEYKKYQNWLENRNENRWVETKTHGQKIDGKSMMHFMRLVNIGREIAEGKGINIRRPDADELLKIRRGEVELQTLFDDSDAILSDMKKLFQNSSLPEEVSQKFIHDLLVKIRKEYYHQRRGVMSILETVDFKSRMINKEVTNPFFIKTYGNLSELQYFISKSVVDKLSEYHDSNFYDIKNEDVPTLLMGGISYNSERWPKTCNLNTGALQKVSLNKFSIIRCNREKITVMAGSDWQKTIQFDIVMWQDTLVAINVKFVEECKDGIGAVDLFKHLGFNIIF